MVQATGRQSPGSRHYRRLAPVPRLPEVHIWRMPTKWAMSARGWGRQLPKILMLKFNEICPPLIERWMGEGLLPGFAEFHRASQIFTALADEVDPVNLEPWIQWYSIHTGLPLSIYQFIRDLQSFGSGRHS